VDLHLTHRAVQRLHYDLDDSSAIHLVPGSGWVTVHLDCDADVDLLLSLVSIALKAHQGRPASQAPPGGCNFHRVTVLARNAAAES
jgi:hypothetical protein